MRYVQKPHSTPISNTPTDICHVSTNWNNVVRRFAPLAMNITQLLMNCEGVQRGIQWVIFRNLLMNQDKKMKVKMLMLQHHLYLFMHRELPGKHWSLKFSVKSPWPFCAGEALACGKEGQTFSFFSFQTLNFKVTAGKWSSHSLHANLHRRRPWETMALIMDAVWLYANSRGEL